MIADFSSLPRYGKITLEGIENCLSKVVQDCFTMHSTHYELQEKDIEFWVNLVCTYLLTILFIFLVAVITLFIQHGFVGIFVTKINATTVFYFPLPNSKIDK